MCLLAIKRRQKHCPVGPTKCTNHEEFILLLVCSVDLERRTIRAKSSLHLWWRTPSE